MGAHLFEEVVAEGRDCELGIGGRDDRIYVGVVHGELLDVGRGSLSGRIREVSLEIEQLGANSAGCRPEDL